MSELESVTKTTKSLEDEITKWRTHLNLAWVALTSMGDDQSAFAAMAYHAFRGCSALGSFSQNMRNVRFAVIRMAQS